MSKFNLLFSGEINGESEIEIVMQKFKEYFQLTDVQTKYIFSGKEIVIKKNLTQEQALKYALHIDELGGVSYFEALEDQSHLPEGVTQDRRKGTRRIKPDRRKHFRAGLAADRRLRNDRRKKQE